MTRGMTRRRSFAIALAALCIGEQDSALAKPAHDAAPQPACEAFARPDALGLFEPFMVPFDAGSARINPTAAAIMQNAASVYRILPNCVLGVRAHTDGWEASSRDPQLAARRARAVIRYFRRLGVTMRTRVATFGDTQPMVEAPKGVAEPQNRRVEFALTIETGG